MTIQNDQLTSRLPQINEPSMVGMPTACDTSTEEKATAPRARFERVGRIGAHINTTARYMKDVVLKVHCFERVRQATARLTMWSIIAAMLLPLNGCGLAALPCRVTSAAVKIVPVVGHKVAMPLDACAAAID